MTDMLRRVTRFGGLGIALGSVFACWVLILVVLGGSWNLRLRTGEHVNAGFAIFGYLLGGAIGGGIVGLLFPLTRWRLGAAIVGIVAVLPFAYGVALSVAGTSGGTIDYVALGFTALLLGGGGGVAYREIFREDS